MIEIEKHKEINCYRNKTKYELKLKTIQMYVDIFFKFFSICFMEQKKYETNQKRKTNLIFIDC